MHEGVGPGFTPEPILRFDYRLNSAPETPAKLYCREIKAAIETVFELLKSPHNEDLWSDLIKANNWIGPDSVSPRPFYIGVEVPEDLDCHFSRNWDKLEQAVPRSPRIFVAEFLELIVLEWEGEVLSGNIVFGHKHKDIYLVIPVASNATPARIDELDIKPVEIPKPVHNN